MLIADKLLFAEFRNTGAGHVEKLLQKIIGGESTTQARVPTEELLAGSRPLFGSMRDPWSWYLALWTLGCSQQGELYQRLVNDKVWERLQGKLQAGPNATGKPDANAPAKPGAKPGAGAGAKSGAGPGGKPGAGGAAAKGDVIKRIVLPPKMGVERAKKVWYASAEDPKGFREWLKVVCALQTRRLVDPGFAQSPISKIGGLMTYRYFHLYVSGADQIPVAISTHEGLHTFEAEHVMAKYILQHDSLTDDLVSALEQSGIALSDAQRKVIYDAKPGAKTSGDLDLERFYDTKTVEIVARREKFIIDRFGYQRPLV